MKGAYIKSAQLISTAFPELLPDAWVRRLELMVDDAPPRPWTTTKRVLERELERPLGELFSAFDEVPVGVAAFGATEALALAAYGLAPWVAATG